MENFKFISKLGAACLLACSMIGVASAEVSGRNAPALAESFVTQIQAGDAAAAVALIQPHWPESVDEIAFQTTALQNHIDERPAEWGDAIGIKTYLSSKTTHIREYSFLVMFEFHAEVWNVQFYKNTLGSQWMINHIQYQPMPNAFNE